DRERRPTLADVLARLGGDPEVVRAVAPAPEEDDPFTIPLALAAHESADASTAFGPVDAPSAPVPVAPMPSPQPPMTRAFPSDDPDTLPVDLEPAPVGVSQTLALRRGALIAGLGLVCGAAATAWPFWGLALMGSV